MKSIEFKNSIDSKRKVLMSLYWVNKKVAVMEGCAPFYIEKIITESTVYLSTNDSSIKLSQVLLKDILKNIEADKKVKFKINMGEECIDTFIHKNVFSVSTTKNKDLERDIAGKLRLESEKKYQSVCSKFKTRVGIS
ncbi:MAG: hypothetical protein B655_0639 [Methanobacterium sp. Maddingley MBC34]|nr:MAG: hypothetical protein B655_0639 [Methanobacterium sp. Maddingley MBC34]